MRTNSINYHEVWIGDMEERYGTDPSNRYGTGIWNGNIEGGHGTGIWNGGGPGPCSGPYNLTCTHMSSKTPPKRSMHRLPEIFPPNQTQQSK